MIVRLDLLADTHLLTEMIAEALLQCLADVSSEPISNLPHLLFDPEDNANQRGFDKNQEEAPPPNLCMSSVRQPSVTSTVPSFSVK